MNVYAQQYPHADAWITGSREDLAKLRDAIDRALADGSSACETFASDGEGFHTVVVAHEATEQELLALPYTYPEYADVIEGKHPFWLLSMGRYKALVGKSDAP